MVSNGLGFGHFPLSRANVVLQLQSLVQHFGEEAHGKAGREAGGEGGRACLEATESTSSGLQAQLRKPWKLPGSSGADSEKP